jgi:hypothetical protein
MRPFLALAIVGLLAAGAAGPGAASLQPQMYCWSGDSEFPVACEDDGEDDEARAGRGRPNGIGPPSPERWQRASPVPE